MYLPLRLRWTDRFFATVHIDSEGLEEHIETETEREREREREIEREKEREREREREGGRNGRKLPVAGSVA